MVLVRWILRRLLQDIAAGRVDQIVVSRLTELRILWLTTQKSWIRLMKRKFWLSLLCFNL